MADKFYCFVTFCFFLHSLYRGVATFETYGTQWELGRYGMPRTMVGEDDWTYADGTRMDPIVRSIVKSGNEEEMFLVAAIVLVTLGVVLTIVIRRWIVRRRQILERIEAIKRYLAADSHT